MIISCIVAKAHNNVIGKDNDIPWYLPADLQYFKKVTINYPVIMGRKCFESIGRPLPKRTNIIITRDPYYIVSDAIVVHGIDEALNIAYDQGAKQAFIIGGGHIYQQTQDLWDEIYITDVDLQVEGDVFFPAVDIDDWILESSIPNMADEKNKWNYTFNKYVRK